MADWRIRPSAMACIAACPGSLQMCSGAPAFMHEDGDNFVRDEGTAAHHVAYMLAVGEPFEVGDLASNFVPIDQPMIDGANDYLATVNSWQTPKVYFEQQLPITDIHPECGGTPDSFAMSLRIGRRPLLHIADFKYGFRLVDAYPNPQLLSYAAGVSRFMGFNIADCDFEFTIAQPRRWSPSGKIRIATADGAAVAQHVAQLAHKVHLATQPNAPLIAGPQCEHCIGRARCPELRNRVFGVSVYPGQDLPLAAAAQELNFLRRHGDLVKAYTTGLEAQIEHELRNGARSKDFELVKTTGKLEWNQSDIGKVKALANAMDRNIAKPVELITPTQALERKLLPESVVSLYAHRSQGALKLVATDPAKWVERFKNGK